MYLPYLAKKCGLRSIRPSSLDYVGRISMPEISIFRSRISRREIWGLRADPTNKPAISLGSLRAPQQGPRCWALLRWAAEPVSAPYWGGTQPVGTKPESASIDRSITERRESARNCSAYECASIFASRNHRSSSISVFAPTRAIARKQGRSKLLTLSDPPSRNS
jgi:hypothetical protein